MTFTLYDPDGNPVLPPFFGIADSGADGSIFPMEVMKDLGIDQTDCDEKDQLGVGGPSKYYKWKGGTLPADFFGQIINLTMLFSETPFILLGREDFFRHFKVTFDQRGLRFAIEAY